MRTPVISAEGRVCRNRLGLMTTVDHKKIGVMPVRDLFMFFLGGVALAVRMELFTPTVVTGGVATGELAKFWGVDARDWAEGNITTAP